jgi:hypothetical protein
MWLSVSLLKTKTATPTLGRDMMTAVLSEFRREVFGELCAQLVLAIPLYICDFSQCPTALVSLHIGVLVAPSRGTAEAPSFLILLAVRALTLSKASTRTS